MKSQEDEITQRILTLLKLDAKRLFERIRDREPEYMYVYSNKRTREHFRDIFKNRYESVGINDLKHCSQEVLIGLDNFYSIVDEMRWYLNHTEEMPSTVEMKVKGYIRQMKPLYETVNLYINAELGLSDSLSSQEKNEAFESIMEPGEGAPKELPENEQGEEGQFELDQADSSVNDFNDELNGEVLWKKDEES